MPFELLEQSEMLCCIPLTLLKFREILNDSLHIFNCIKLSLTFLGLKELLNHVMDGICHITEIGVHYLLEKSVFIARECDFLHLIGQMGQVS